MNISCLIIDHDPEAIKLLETFIQKNTKWQLAAKCFDGGEAINFLSENKVDFIFSEINMPKFPGMEMAALLPKETNIVFTTAYSEFAAESYFFQTIDYLLKPIDLKRFLVAVQKIESHFNVKKRVKLAAAYPDFFFVKSGKSFSKILLSDILYFEGEKEYVRIVTSSEQLLIYRRLKDIQEQLNIPFMRIHNSYIINIRQLDKIQDNHVFIANKQIPISEKFKGNFMSLIQEKLF